MDENKTPSHRLFGIRFGVYSSKEIKSLSVREVTNPNSFDSLGHPTSGGLYDPALGPSEKNDVCSTCGQNTTNCPGHIGHISLPLPVYNPVLFKTLFQLLRGSCMQCHMMLTTKGTSYMLQKQMELLDAGLVTAVERIKEVFTNVLIEVGGTEIGNFDVIKQRLEESTVLILSNNERADKVRCTKNITDMKQNIIKDFLVGEYFIKTPCPHCRSSVRPLRQERFSKIYHSSGMKRNQAIKTLTNKKKMKKKQQSEENEETPEIEEVEMDNSETGGKLSEEDMEKELAALLEQAFLTQTKVQEHFRAVWKNESGLLKCILGALKIHFDTNSMEHPTDIFFIDVMPVPPPKFRPVSVVKEKKFDNKQTASMAQVVADSQLIKEILFKQSKTRGEKSITEVLISDEGNTDKSEAIQKVHKLWTQMQVHVNCVVDSDLDKLNTDKQPGIKQLIEKKEGLFRKHMMGKRVNFAARSVISPDPYINTNEIGIPDIFARKLTYPQPVTPWNFQELKQAVINGPNVHPGACYVINEDGKQVRLSPSDATQREAIAKQLLTPSVHASGNAPNKQVLRHLKNGDILLLNRQPTLHRPSIQAHRARILPGEKTLRLHYSNCKAYNADFDGDEMNAHFPQNEIARAEAYTIGATDFQYLVPKDGTPLAGLIQDHIIGGVNLTIRGRFFDREDYQRLVYDGITDKKGPIKLLRPVILKPKVLWSGKQVLSTILLNTLPANKPPITLEGSAKVSSKNWLAGSPRVWLAGGTPLKGDNMSESEVVIHQGELLVGVLDKAHYGPTQYGLVHSCYELYGGHVAGLLLTSFGKLFTKVLQILGFTLGVEDILCKYNADHSRRKIMEEGVKTGPAVAAKALGVKDYQDEKKLFARMQEAKFCNNGVELKDLDLSMKGQTDEIQNQIAKSIMPNGLVKRFPQNSLQLMVQAGAKGSSVNCMQISCLLGQIELEGRRPPLMMSGRFLPSFLPYDPSPRAGGFVDGRFLTGIRPQEYFFHCMAGREGLVDTAVKTSRSGYLQRCIIKHLEGLTVNYDLTVRDSDGSIVQFEYGEDSLDILQTQYLNKKQFPFLIHNKEAVFNERNLEELKKKVDIEKAAEAWKRVKKWKEKAAKQKNKRISGFLRYSHKYWGEVTKEVGTAKELIYGRTSVATELCHRWNSLTKEDKLKYNKKHQRYTLEPVVTRLRPQSHFGAITEQLDKLMLDYTTSNPDKMISENSETTPSMTSNNFKQLIRLKSMQSLVHPGESVGLLAAQSIGEPSTQMTLNTFHFAGRGEMNVTLGIPRLREILCVASVNIKTPSMDIPLLNTPEAHAKAPELKLKLTKVLLSQVLESISVTESLSVKVKSEKCRLYKIHFRFLPYEMYMNELSVNPVKVLNFMEKKFFQHFQEVVKKNIELDKKSVISSGRVKRSIQEEAQHRTAVEDDVAADVEDDDQNDGDATAARQRDRQIEERDYEGEDEERKAVDNEGDDDDDDELENDCGDSQSTSSGGDDDEDSDFAPDPDTPTKEYPDAGRIAEMMDVRRKNNVLASVSTAKDYSYDPVNELWCEITLGVGLGDKKLDMTSIVESEAKKSVVYCKEMISRAFLSDSRIPGEEGTHLKTEGCNILEMYKYDKILDINKLYTNDIMAVMHTYGIEAACKTLIKEMRDVFAAYGISVDYHHLSLIADYMTFEGTYKPFNRVGIESNSSPLQKMTFETTMNFLKSATLQGATDDLTSPSSRIVVGKVVGGGTGCFDLLQPLVR